MISTIIATVVNFYIVLIFIYILMSWLPMRDGGFLADVYRVLGSLCDPYLNIFRRIIPPVGGSGMRIDFSPIVAVIVLEAVAGLVLRLL